MNLVPSASIAAYEASLKAALTGIATIVDLRAETLALASDGLKVQTLIDKVAGDIEIAQTLTIDSAEMLEEAQQIAGRLASVCADSGAIEDERKALVSPFNDLVKKVNEGYKAPRVFIGNVLNSLRAKILDYDREQKRLADEQAAIERKRREDELVAAQAREAQAAAAAQKLLDQAAQAQTAGSAVTAQALIAEAGVRVDTARQEAAQAVIALHSRVFSAPAAKAKGVRGKWKACVIDKPALILHIADRIRAGDNSLNGLLDVNESALNSKANLEEDGFSLPGVTAEFVESLAVRKVAVS